MQFGGGAAGTVVSPIALAIIFVCGVMICVCGRKWAIAAFLLPAILIPEDQVLLIGTLHFPMLRVLACVGLGRLLWARFSGKEQVFAGGMNNLDKALIGLALSIAVNGVLLWRDTGEIVVQLGNLCTAFGVYFLLRFLVRDSEDLKQIIRVLAIVAAAVAAIMITEQVTGKNPVYSLLGGARADVFETVITRDEHFRASASFGHPILAGTFGGILFPLFVGLWWIDKKSRYYAVLGAVAAVIIPFCASSSTALMGLFGGLLGLFFWPVRRWMRAIRWGIVTTLILLHIVMKAPVWDLISRVDLTGGSSSYHRFQLLNQCILHFWDWALIGSKTYGFWGWDMWDLCNQYVAYADPSGLIPLICFLTMIVLGFRYVGKARRSTRDRKEQFFLWALGSALFANVVAFFGISYFDQTIVAWYALLAMILAATISVRRGRRRNTGLGSKDKLSIHVPVESPDWAVQTAGPVGGLRDDEVETELPRLPITQRFHTL